MTRDILLDNQHKLARPDAPATRAEVRHAIEGVCDATGDILRDERRRTQEKLDALAVATNDSLFKSATVARLKTSKLIITDYCSSFMHRKSVALKGDVPGVVKRAMGEP